MITNDCERSRTFTNEVNVKINSHLLFFIFWCHKKRIENNTYENDDNWDGIYLQPGMNTGVLLEREFKSFMPKPYSECDIDNHAPSDFQSDLYKLINRSPYQYCQVIIKANMNEII